jgi:hypothetical protein
MKRKFQNAANSFFAGRVGINNVILQCELISPSLIPFSVLVSFFVIGRAARAAEDYRQLTSRFPPSHCGSLRTQTASSCLGRQLNGEA